MSLYGSIQMGGNSLQAIQIGLQVVGNNIANANTPGFVREQVVYKPAPQQRIGNLQIGLGVQVDGIIQQVDRFVQERLVAASSDRAGAEVQEKAFRDLETLLGELSDTDLSTAMSGFFNSVDEVLETPGDISVRNLVVLKGEALARDFNELSQRAQVHRRALNDRVVNMADEINLLTQEIRTSNLRIAQTEGGDGSSSDAGALCHQRQAAVDKLAELVDIRVTEQASGGLAISVGGEYLVFEAQLREVTVDVEASDGLSLGTIEFVDTRSPLLVSGGELHGLYAARDEIVGGFLEDLDHLAASLAFEFNKVHSQGQGLVGFDSVTSVESVLNPQDPLDAVGLPFTPVHGDFNIHVRSAGTGGSPVYETANILVDLNGLEEDDTLESLVAQINDKAEGITASVSATGQLTISADSEEIEFAFAGDSSGLLAALGINTFFAGSTAQDLRVNDVLDDERLFAASLGGVDADSRNAERMAAFLETPLEAAEGSSLADLYDQVVNNVSQGATIAQSVADGFRVFESTLEAEHQAVSGVNVDEEAIRMIMLQRAYQANARFIQTVSELLDILVNL